MGAHVVPVFQTNSNSRYGNINWTHVRAYVSVFFASRRKRRKHACTRGSNGGDGPTAAVATAAAAAAVVMVVVRHIFFFLFSADSIIKFWKISQDTPRRAVPRGVSSAARSTSPLFFFPPALLAPSPLYLLLRRCTTSIAASRGRIYRIKRACNKAGAYIYILRSLILRSAKWRGGNFRRSRRRLGDSK